MTWRKLLLDHRDYLIVFITPLLLIPLPVFVTDQKGTCGYMLLLMGVYWCTEALPLGVTGLIPVFLAPLFGILTTVQVCENYLKDSTMMFTGGLFVAIALEKSNLHLRIALFVLRLVGTEPKWLMFGFMLPTWFLSMWISNTATTAMMLPILEAVLVQLKEHMNNQATQTDTELGYTNKVNPLENELSHLEKNRNFRPQSPTDTVELKHIKLVEGSKQESNDLNNDTNRMGENLSNNNNAMALDQEHEDDLNSIEKDGEDHEEATDAYYEHLCRGMTLAVAYAANVGGTATLTGTSPNTILKGAADEIWQENGFAESPVTYTSWLIYGFPQAVINLALVYLWLRVFYLGFSSFSCKKTINEEQDKAVQSYINEEYKKLGSMRYEEAMVGTLFITLVLLWFFRAPGFMKGWGDYFEPGYIGDAVPAIFIATLMFCIPNKVPNPNRVEDTGKADALLDWPMVHKKYPWSIIFLMGGGFALAEACEVSGLSQWIGEQLSVFGSLPGWLMVAIICFLVAMLTEVTSNSATCTILMPIVAAMAEELNQNPLYLMMPTAIATSFAFMLPVATPPNAIAFSYGRITVLDMMKAGALLNLLCVFTVTLATHTWAYDYFDYGTIPWATNTSTNVTQSKYIEIQMLD